MKLRLTACLGALAVASILACQSAGPASTGSGAAAAGGAGIASVRIEVLRGFAPAALSQIERRVVVLADLRGRDSRTRRATADRAATFASALPPTTGLKIHVVGNRGDGACSPGTTYEEAPAPALERLAATRGGGGGSLAAALDRATADATSGTRLVAFTTADDSCSDVCGAAERAAERGIWVDWVLPAEASPQACLEAHARAVAGPGPIATGLAAPQAAFQVRRGSTPDGPALASGTTGDTVELAAGEVTVWLDLEPPEPVGPLHLAAGQRLYVRVLDFPMTDPPLRRWWVERQGGP